ncbi:MAG: PatB family C-S lyase [Gammaproteobacteria bacterium]|nr:PatB family C-S lyase [Gammaproteobacteria bacterium]
MLSHDFDEVIDRRKTPALKVHPRVLGEGGQDIFAASVADMDFKIPPIVTAALQKRLDHGIFGYEAVPDDLFPALINWLYHRHGWRVEQDHILRAPNILNTLAIAASLFTKEGDGIIVQPPVFHDFFDIVLDNHRTLISNPLILEAGRYHMDFDHLERQASKPNTTMIYLCNPHNPIGRVWTSTELKRLGGICLQHNILVVSDEMHGDITFNCHKYTPFAALGNKYANNSIICLSPGKTFNIASCSSAFTIISDGSRRRDFQVENSRLTVNKNNAFASVAMKTAYKEGGPWLDALLAYLENNVALVRDYLKDIPGVELIEPEGTFLLWLDFRALGFDEPKSLTAFLKKEARWSVARGEAFGIEGEGFVRVNIGCTKANLAQALFQLKIAILNRG